MSEAVLPNESVIQALLSEQFRVEQEVASIREEIADVREPYTSRLRGHVEVGNLNARALKAVAHGYKEHRKGNEYSALTYLQHLVHYAEVTIKALEGQGHAGDLADMAQRAEDKPEPPKSNGAEKLKGLATKKPAPTKTAAKKGRPVGSKNRPKQDLDKLEDHVVDINGNDLPPLSGAEGQGSYKQLN